MLYGGSTRDRLTNQLCYISQRGTTMSGYP
jgi:hypothetical protein